MFNFLTFFSKRNNKLTHQSAINLIYDKNIHTLRNRIKILIVDDEHLDLVDILREHKYDIYYKKDITYAIEAEAFDIIIIDILGIASALKSNMGGFAVAEEIKKRYPAKQVWCCSGKTIKQEIASRIQQIDGYINKDSDIDDWCEKLDNIIQTYCSDDYQIEILKNQLKKYGVSEDDITQVVQEYKNNLDAKNFNSVINMISGLVKNGKQVLELIQLIYTFVSHFTV